MSKELENQVYGLFDDDYLKEYSDIIKTYQEGVAKREELKGEAKTEYRENAKEKISELQRQKKNKAMEIIEEFKESKQFKFPEKPSPTLKEDKILNETKRSTELTLIREEIKATEDPTELLEIAREYEDDGLLGRDVDRLVKAELKRRGETNSIDRLNNERKPDLKDVQGLENAVSLLTNNENFAVIQPTKNGNINPDFRNIDKDLKQGETPTNGEYNPEILKEIKGGE